MRAFPPLCGLVLAIVAIHAEDAKPESPPATPGPRAPAIPGADWRHLSSSRLREDVKTLLYDSNFDELDAIAAEVNDKQMRYTTGTWKLHTFFEAVSGPRQPTDPEDWKVLFRRLQEWDDRSHTVFSTGAIAQTQLNYAWYVRTGAWAAKVTPEQWQVFNDGVARSLATYTRVLKYPVKCVDTYNQLLRIGLAQGWPAEKMAATLREAISVVPDYYPCFEVFGFYTLERWYGKPGDTRRFLDSIPTMVPADKADEVYTRTAVSLWRFYKDDFFGAAPGGCADWPTMRKGFLSIVTKYQNDRVMRNNFAAFACLAKDRATARSLLDDLTAKREIERDAWTPAGGFESGKKWIMESEGKGE